MRIFQFKYPQSTISPESERPSCNSTLNSKNWKTDKGFRKRGNTPQSISLTELNAATPLPAVRVCKFDAHCQFRGV
jgi:hypothetical protein